MQRMLLEDHNDRLRAEFQNNYRCAPFTCIRETWKAREVPDIEAEAERIGTQEVGKAVLRQTASNMRWFGGLETPLKMALMLAAVRPRGSNDLIKDIAQTFSK